jgi:hypothetical protein
MANPSPAVRQAGNICCLLVIERVSRSSISSGGSHVKDRCRCRVKLLGMKLSQVDVGILQKVSKGNIS